MIRIINDFKKYWEYNLYAAKAQLKVEVANSKLNWVWWILEPFCFMLIYSFVYGVVFNAREENMSLFLFLGLSMWQFFSRCVKGSVGLVKNQKSIVGKVYMPKYMLIIQKMLVNMFKLGINMLLTVGMMIFYRVGVTWKIIYIIPVFMILFLVTFGVSCFMLHWGVYLDDLGNIMDIVIRMLMYFTGIFYSVEKRMPAPLGAIATKWNPLALLLTSARNILIYHKSLDATQLIFWLLISCVVAYAGIQVIYNNENSYIKVV